MPTSVSAARQFLTEEAARALDDAVSVAKCRSHAQATSLHVLSALFALPNSILREACSRARRTAYSPRLQFRALELSVGVSLDRLPSSKEAPDELRVSNSLLAAIKRSQASQRRHPDTFHLYQQLNYQNSCQPSISAVKVELKHFVLSILDDPIVSRVFGEAGYWSTDIKLAILNPPTISRFSKTRFPPLFSGNFSDLESNKRGFNFPFPGVIENVDENSRRVVEILVKESLRNPLLIGVYAAAALKNFTVSLQGGKNEVLPKEIHGVSVISIQNEISEFVNGGFSEDTMRLKFKELRDMVAKCEGPGIILNCGDLGALVDVESVDTVNYMVSELNRLLNSSGGKLWLIGAVADDSSYKKLLAQYSSIETDWDLHLLPITSFKPSSIESVCSKSSLMGSFVPFGGFFPMPSEYEPLCTTQSSTLCNLCKEKCEQEVSDLKGESTVSVIGQQSEIVSSWLQIAECDMSKSSVSVEAKDDKTVLDARIMGLRRKWSDICQHLHCTRSFQEDISHRSQFSGDRSSQVVSVFRESAHADLLLDKGRVTNLSPCISLDMQNKLKPVASDINANAKAELPVQGWKIHQTETNVLQNPSCAPHKLSLPIDCMMSPSITHVTTDLGLGTLYSHAVEERRNSNPQENYNCIQYFSGSSRTSEDASHKVTQSSSCSYGQLEKPIGGKDLEYPWKILAENVHWQIEAIRTICQTVSRCRTGNGIGRGSDKRNVWLSFLGPDKVGKRKIAASLAETIFDRKEHLLSVDLGTQFEIRACNSVFDHHDSKYFDLKFGRKMVVDYIAEELSKQTHSVVLLENIERADFLVQNSLSQAIKIGKFRDSNGREIGINNTIFVLTSRLLKAHDNLFSAEVSYEYSEEIVSKAKYFQMQILIGSISENYSRNSTANVLVTPSKVTAIPCSVTKRKLVDNESTKTGMPKRMCEMPRSILDLNLPIEEMEQDNDIDYDKCDETKYEVWLEELLGHVDENVVFKPFDFDSLALKVLNMISLGFQKVVGPDIFLEIDQEVMVQILAAAWLTDRENAVEDWIEQVLCSSLMEAHRRCHVNGDSVMKLVACEGGVVEEQFSGVCLPTRIILH